jgi:hypothetical protein
MSTKAKGLAAVAAAVALCLGIATAGIAAKRVQHIGASTEIESSITKAKRSITVTGVIESSVARCERQRSVLLYEAGASGNITGGAIGHGVSQGGANRGQFTIQGLAPKKILSDRRFIAESVARNVKVKGQEKICKRSVSVDFPGTFGG